LVAAAVQGGAAPTPGGIILRRIPGQLGRATMCRI
jgi:hypothetical protein